MSNINRLWRDQTGATAIEYALLLVLLGVAAFASYQGAGAAARALYERIYNAYPKL